MALTNSQYDAIMRIYEQKHLRTHDRLNRHYDEIYEKIPRIREIDDQISHLGVSNAKALIDGQTDATGVFVHSFRLSPPRNSLCFYRPVIRQTIWSLPMNATDAGIPVMWTAGNAVVFRKRRLIFFTRSLIFRTF